MTADFHVSIDISQAKRGLDRLHPSVVSAVEPKLLRGAEEVAGVAKENAPKFQSNLINSIRAEQVGELHFVVSEHVPYGRAVEEGTGPAAGKAKYFPDVQSLYQTLQSSPSSRGFGWKKSGSKGRSDQEMELVFRAKAWAWHIYNHGTPKHPYMKPAAETKTPRVRELVLEGVEQGSREAFNV